MKYVNKCGFMIRQEFATMCKLNRQLHGYTQSDIAEQCFVSPSCVREFERGLSDNVNIVLWHFLHGLKADEVQKMISNVQARFINGEV